MQKEMKEIAQFAFKLADYTEKIAKVQLQELK